MKSRSFSSLFLGFLLLGLVFASFTGDISAQDEVLPPTDAANSATDQPAPDDDSLVLPGDANQEEGTLEDRDDTVADETEDVTEQLGDVANNIKETLDKDETAKQVSAGILEPIYLLAEYFSFPAFHWVAFMLMVTGVVSFALQLVLAKLAVLARMSFSVTEVLSDALCLVISLVGLVLTTQAAAENSTFASSAGAVVSATAVGVLLGLIFYIWGQRQELRAATGAKVEAKEEKKKS